MTPYNTFQVALNAQSVSKANFIYFHIWRVSGFEFFSPRQTFYNIRTSVQAIYNIFVFPSKIINSDYTISWIPRQNCVLKVVLSKPRSVQISYKCSIWCVFRVIKNTAMWMCTDKSRTAGHNLCDCTVEVMNIIELSYQPSSFGGVNQPLDRKKFRKPVFFKWRKLSPSAK